MIRERTVVNIERVFMFFQGVIKTVNIIFMDFSVKAGRAFFIYFKADNVKTFNLKFFVKFHPINPLASHPKKP